ncbi:ferritin-like domain-containing protein [Hymenobacter persicinus]|nr:ferritin-like domain-containing protein [Hymenobacter persicinus]
MKSVSTPAFPEPTGRVAGPALGRRSFLFYSGASVALGSLWLAGCTKKEALTPGPITAAPTIDAFTPAAGAPGTVITITGTNFTGATAVTLGGLAVPYTVVSATTITVTLPVTAATGALAVTTPGGTATSSTPFTVLPPASTITSFSPQSGLPGTIVTLIGTNFTGATRVTLGGATTVFSVVNATTITLTVPATAQTGVFVVTTPGGTGSSATVFTVLPQFVNVGTGDLGVLNYVYALEQLEAAFYASVKAGSYFAGASAAEKAALTDIAGHELLHREYLKAVLGSNAIKDLETDFSAINFGDRAAVLAAARSFEDLGVAAYNGAAAYLTTPTYLLVLGKISSVEARHAALIRDFLTYNTFVGADIIGATSGLETAKTPAVVVTAANSYLKVGSKLDVSGLQ